MEDFHFLRSDEVCSGTIHMNKILLGYLERNPNGELSSKAANAFKGSSIIVEWYLRTANAIISGQPKNLLPRITMSRIELTIVDTVISECQHMMFDELYLNNRGLNPRKLMYIARYVTMQAITYTQIRSQSYDQQLRLVTLSNTVVMFFDRLDESLEKVPLRKKDNLTMSIAITFYLESRIDGEAPALIQANEQMS